MRSGFVRGPLEYAAKRVPGLKRVPVLKLFIAAELAVLARDHIMRLNRQERRRLVELARISRGRRRKLSEAEREELATLLARVEPRLFFGTAVDRLSPVHLPRRVVYGRRRRG